MFITSENFVKYIDVGSLGPCRLRSGGKRQKKGVNCEKYYISEERKIVVGRTTAWLASLTEFFLLLLFFFLPTPIFFSFSPNAEPGPRLRGWLYLQGSTAFGVSTGNGVYTVAPDVLSLTIPYQFSSGIFEWLGWGGCVCVCNELGWNRCYAIM